MRYQKKCLSQKLNFCNVCGGTKDLVVHHIDADRSNNQLDNLVPVCTDCHHRIHGPERKTDHELIDYYRSKLHNSTEYPYDPDKPIQKSVYISTDLDREVETFLDESDEFDSFSAMVRYGLKEAMNE